MSTKWRDGCLPCYPVLSRWQKKRRKPFQASSLPEQPSSAPIFSSHPQQPSSAATLWDHPAVVRGWRSAISQLLTIEHQLLVVIYEHVLWKNSLAELSGKIIYEKIQNKNTQHSHHRKKTEPCLKGCFQEAAPVGFGHHPAPQLQVWWSHAQGNFWLEHSTRTGN